MIDLQVPGLTSGRDSGPARPSRSPSLITQSELKRFQELQQLRSEYDALRKSFLKRREHNASIEPGPLDLEVIEGESRIFSFPKLVEVGGQEWAEAVRDRITPTHTTTVKVVGGRSQPPRPIRPATNELNL